MIDIKIFEKNKDGNTLALDEYKQGLTHRGASTAVVDEIIKLNTKRKECLTTAETAKAQQNKISAEVGKLKREGKDASGILAEVDKLKAQVKELETTAAQVDQDVYNILLTIPNKPHSSVPVGKSEHDNQIVKTVGEPKKFSFKAKVCKIFNVFRHML